MGQHLTVVSGDIATSLQSVLDASPSYRHQLRQLLHQYQSDPSLSAAQILQWSGEKLVADATNETHEIGARFLPMLAKIDLGKLDASTVTQCIAQAAMQYLEELKLDMNLHVRFLSCAATGSVEKLQKIRPFVDLNYQNESGSTALMLACHEHHVPMVSFLLSLGVNANLRDSLGWTALMFCARDGHEDLIDLLLSSARDPDIDIVANNGINALMCAADAGHVQIVKKLMELGADVNACTNAGDTALLQSCHGGHTLIVRLLLSAHADVNVSGKHLCSPSLLAARFGSYDILELLVQHGADIAAQDDEGRTVCDFEYEGQVAAAIQRGVVARFNKMIITPTSSHGHWPTHAAAWRLEEPNSSQHARRLPQGSVSTVTDSPSSSSSSMTAAAALASSHSQSRTPSPAVPVRGRPRKTHTRPPETTNALPRSRSNAFHHPGVTVDDAGGALSDAALAELEAGVERIMHRHGPANDSVSKPAEIVTSSILKSSRPAADPVAPSPLIVMPRSASDNVHRFDDVDSDAAEYEEGDAPTQPISEPTTRHNNEPPPRRHRSRPPLPRTEDEIDEADLEPEEGDDEEASEPSFSDAEESHEEDANRKHVRSKTVENANYMAALDAHLAAARSPMSDDETHTPTLVASPSESPSPRSPSPPPADSTDVLVCGSSSPSDDALLAAELTRVQDGLSIDDTVLQLTAHIDADIEAEEKVAQMEEAEVGSANEQSAAIEPQTTQLDSHCDDAVVLPNADHAQISIDAGTESGDQHPSSPSMTALLPLDAIADSSTSHVPVALDFASSSLTADPASAAASASESESRSATVTSKRRARRKKKVVDIGAAPIAPIISAALFGAMPATAPPARQSRANSFLSASNTNSPAHIPTTSRDVPPTIAIAAPATTAPLVTPHDRLSQERAVDEWLVSSGFDSVSRAALSGFTFADLHSLDLNDCSELLGDRVGPTLYTRLRQRAKGSPTTREVPHLSGDTDERRRSWAEAAVNGMRAAAVADVAEKTTRTKELRETEQTISDLEEDAAPAPAPTAPLAPARPLAPVSPQVPTASPRPPVVAHPTALPVSSGPPAATRSSGLSFHLADLFSAPISAATTVAKRIATNSAATSSAQTARSAHAIPPTRADAISIQHAASAAVPVSAATVSAVNHILAQQGNAPAPPRTHAHAFSAARAPASPRATSSTSSSPARPVGLPPLPASPPAPTGFYTQDLLNAQKAWLTSSLESVRYSLRGTSRREEMRKNQPHRVRRSQVSASASEDDEAAAAPLSAWDRLGLSPRRVERETTHSQMMAARTQQPAAEKPQLNMDYLTSF